jgi:hypothetical protein
MTAIPVTDYTGSTNPAVGSHTYVVGATAQITATSAVFTQTSPTYFISTDGTYYYAKNDVGLILTQNSDFSTMINAFFGQILQGSIVNIANGIYIVHNKIMVNINSITIIGGSNTTLRADPSLTGYMFEIPSTGTSIKNIIFDSNYNGSISPSVMIDGSYDTVTYCTFINAVQYNLEVWRGDHFTITHNTVRRSQYGIATGGTGEFCNYGVIAYNNIADCHDCGIKIRWCKNLDVYNNIIDTGLYSWTPSNTPPYMTESWHAGIRFYQYDGPNFNITIHNNNIVDNTQNDYTVGIMCDDDASYLNFPPSDNLIAINNTISNCYYGVMNYWRGGLGGGLVINGNTISGSRANGIRIRNTAFNTLIINNNIINSQGYGIMLDDGSHITQILNNIITGSKKAPIYDHGIGTLYN